MRAHRAVRSTAIVALLALVALLGLVAGPGPGPAPGGPGDDLVAGRKWGHRTTAAASLESPA